MRARGHADRQPEMEHGKFETNRQMRTADVALPQNVVADSAQRGSRLLGNPIQVGRQSADDRGGDDLEMS